MYHGWGNVANRQIYAPQNRSSFTSEAMPAPPEDRSFHRIYLAIKYGLMDLLCDRDLHRFMKMQINGFGGKNGSQRGAVWNGSEGGDGPAPAE